MTYNGAMRGHYHRQSPGSWRLSVYVGTDPVTGNKRRVYRTVRGTERQAQTALARLIADVSRGAHQGSETTVAELLHEWIPRARVTDAVRSDYQGIATNYLEPTLGKTPLHKLRAVDLDRLYTSLRPKLGPARIRRVHTVIRGALAQAVRWEWVGTNVALSASPPSVPAHRINPPDATAVRKLLLEAETGDPAFLAFLYLAASTGARRGELAGLHWRDVNLSTGTLTIERSIRILKGGLQVKGTKTDRVRAIALNQPTVAALTRHRAFCAAASDAWLMPLTDDSYVFAAAGDNARPWRPDSVSRRFARLRARVGLEHVRLHDLRHFVATQLIANGVDPVTVAGRLGHKDPHVTLLTYSHFVPAKDRDAADLLGRILDDTDEPDDTSGDS